MLQVVIDAVLLKARMKDDCGGDDQYTTINTMKKPSSGRVISFRTSLCLLQLWGEKKTTKDL